MQASTAAEDLDKAKASVQRWMANTAQKYGFKGEWSEFIFPIENSIMYSNYNPDNHILATACIYLNTNQ